MYTKPKHKMFRSTLRKSHQDIRSATVQSMSFWWILKTVPWRHYPAMDMIFLSRLRLPKQHCKNNLDDESWNSNEIVDYEDGKWLVYLMVSIHFLQVIQVPWSVKRKPVETSPLFRITRHHLLLSLQVLSYFSDCYVPSRNLVGTNWKKIYFWI